jgi:outer membrane protein OmpA-like peptidoglycan-associated protein
VATNLNYLFQTTAALAGLCLFGSIAHAQVAEVREGEAQPLASGLQLSLKVEPGLAAALSDPQSDRTELGMGTTAKVLFGLNRYLQIGPSIAFTTLPATGQMTQSGRAWTFGAGGRLMRPHDAPGHGISPWIDVDLVYARTGALSRPGFATAVGVSMPLDNRRQFWVGPFARYFQVIQGEREGFDNRDAKIVMFGLGLEITSGLERKRARVATVEPAPIVDEPVAPPPSYRDGDTVIYTADNCPDVAGLVEQSGCPAYEKVVVKREKLEVKEKIAFAWDSAKLEPASYPALDEVVRALQENRGFKVQVDGHASSDGNYDHNQTLSEKRAEAVLDYLVAHGVAKDRLVSKGFSSSQPTETNTTAAGRDSNRRVEFVVDFIIIQEGNTP